MKILRRCRLIRDEGGQALVEAVITQCVLALAWILFFFAGFMAGNGIRCVSAARHVAWMKGNGLEPDPIEIAADFFSRTNEVSIAFAERDIDSEDPLEDANNSGNDGGSGFSIMSILANVIIWAPPVWSCDVSFGIDQVGESDGWSYALMKTELPFMRETSLMEEWLRVDAHCEWEQVNDTWKNPGDVFEALWDGVLDTFGL